MQSSKYVTWIKFFMVLFQSTNFLFIFVTWASVFLDLCVKIPQALEVRRAGAGTWENCLLWEPSAGRSDVKLPLVAGPRWSWGLSTSIQCSEWLISQVPRVGVLIFSGPPFVCQQLDTCLSSSACFTLVRRVGSVSYCIICLQYNLPEPYTANNTCGGDWLPALEVGKLCDFKD